MKSTVEKIALRKSPFRTKYSPTEKINCIVVDNFPALGKLTALRFLEWVQLNPEGVISLPTGKSPEYFIKEVRQFLNKWQDKDVQQELEVNGIENKDKPDLRGLHFVQIDEFYPIDPRQHNSFFSYVNKYYIDGFGLSPQKALLINCLEIGLPKDLMLREVWPDNKVDLSLRYRNATGRQEALQKQVLENIDQWCAEYEERIRALGGIGFFLGGLGPDGHIGFNIKGSDFNSTTRLTPTNYETQAAAATDLGGIEVSRNRLVITIGLATITFNRDCVAIVIAAGEAKAQIVANAVENTKHIRYPATVLQDLRHARFFLTQGAAKLLSQRQVVVLKKTKTLSDAQVERVVIDLAIKHNKRIDQLTGEDFGKSSLGALVLERTARQLSSVKKKVRHSLEQKIVAGATVQKNKTFLHTEPHHDDLMLGYLPLIVRHIREHSNQHFFATLTSGFTAVTNPTMVDLLKKLRHFLARGIFDRLFENSYFEPENTVGRNRDTWRYLDGVAAHSNTWKDEGQSRRLLRNICDIYNEKNPDALLFHVEELIHTFETRYPGQKDDHRAQKLKGMVREWEADCLWGYFGWHSQSVHHLRLGFYKGDIFTEEPTLKRDVAPILRLLREIKPDIVSVALDPEASGPDTHYKVLQATAEALKIYERESERSDLQILGYRNVWYRFHPSEADIVVPVSLNMFALQDNSFKNSYISQRDASFPSYEHDGPFSELAQRIQVEQYQMLKTCLGREFFYEHTSALIRATRGLVFLKSMQLKEFYHLSRELRKTTEDL